MIPRYARPEMVAVWEPQTRFRIWFEIEAYACDALAEIGVIPKESTSGARIFQAMLPSLSIVPMASMSAAE